MLNTTPEFEDRFRRAVEITRELIRSDKAERMIARLGYLNVIVQANENPVATPPEQMSDVDLADLGGYSTAIDSRLTLLLVALETGRSLAPLDMIAKAIPGSIRWDRNLESDGPPFSIGALAAFVQHALLGGLVGNWTHLDADWDWSDGKERIMLVSTDGSRNQRVISVAIPDSVVWVQEKDKFLLRSELD